MTRFLSRLWRSIAGNPSFSIPVIVTIGLGIGISTSAFTVLDRLVLRAPPQVREPGELKRLVVTHLPKEPPRVAVDRTTFSYPEYRAIVAAAEVPAQVTSYWSWPDRIPIRLNGEILPARVLGVATNYFAVLGVRPALGRAFAAPGTLVAAGGGPAEVVISEEFWVRALGRRPDAIGAVVDLHKRQLRVVGVAPARFDGLGLDGPDMWIPAEFVGPETWGPNWQAERNANSWAVVFRMAPHARGADISQRVQVALIVDAESAGGSPEEIGPIKLWSLQQSTALDFAKEIRLALALWVVSLVVLVTTSINAGSLFLVHGLEQQRNTAVAMALGGRRGRIVGSRVLEGVALALAGAALGTLLAKAGSAMVRVTLANYIHYTEAQIDYRPLGYAVLLALVVGAVASALPALRATKIDLRGLLDEGGLGGTKGLRRLTTVIHCVQIGFAVVVLYGAALFVQSGRRARATPLGMDLQDVVIGYAFLAKDGVPEDQAARFWERVTLALKDDPAVETVALSLTLPFHSYSNAVASTDEAPDTWRAVSPSNVSPDYLKAFRMRVLAGRELAESDREGAEPVALINRSGARLLWSGSDAVGRCLHMDRSAPTRCVRIVGIVEDTRQSELVEPDIIQVFTPLFQLGARATSPYLVVRPKPGMQPVVSDRTRRLMAEQSPPGTQIEVKLMAESFETLIGPWVRSAKMLSLFALLSGLVTFMGIYGSITYDLMRRRREFGIRLALGARPAQLTQGVVRIGLRWSFYGVAIGAGGAFWLAMGVRALLFGTAPWDPGALLGSLALVVSLGAIAGWLGARRAAVKDPVFLLRSNR